MIENKRTFWQKVLDRSICCVKNVYYYFADSIRLYFARKTFRPSEKPLISIIIPTRNRQELLKQRALRSLILQTYKNWELIIVDDGSNMAWILPDDDRIKKYWIPKKFHYPKNAWCVWAAGPVRALNHALTKVKGDYILRMNDHDILYPEAIETLINSIKGTSTEFVFAQHLGNGELVNPYIMRGKKVGGIQVSLMLSYLKCFKYNKDCWRKNWNSPNELDLIDRMLRSGVRTIYLPKVVGEINPRPNEENLIGWQAHRKFYNDPEKM